MRRHRKVKIVATLGPSSSDFATIRALFEAGADVFRLNMSHGTHDEQRARYDIIRRVEAESGRPIAVLADLQGPKLRVGTFAQGPHDLHDGQSFAIGGLVRNNLVANLKGLPGLSDVPILGALFRSTDFQQERTELVFVITARLVKPLPAGSLSLPTDRFDPPSRAGVLLGGRLEGTPASSTPASSTPAIGTAPVPPAPAPAAAAGLHIGEYHPSTVKKAVVGTGGADKKQIQAMMAVLLPGAKLAGPDAADALAVAITHAHHVASAAALARRSAGT